MKHPDVKCTHCLLDIVGARFHCAICDSVDICSNCESAGLPGNLDSFYGGHNSSHIMIKIPIPLESSEVKTASKRAVHLWHGRDAANVGYYNSTESASPYAKTIVGSSGEHDLNRSPEDHDILCRGCNKSIIGVRYQCASCPSRPSSISLCAQCEERSYDLHNPYHVFFKLSRPVDHPISSEYPMIPNLYKYPVGMGQSDQYDPKAYLKLVQHVSALCDCCVTRIQGEWFRCAYCGRDLCDTCQLIDTHDETHVFLVFKAPVDMRKFREFADPENPSGSPPVISHAVYD